MSEYNIDILGVQEHRGVNKDEITFENKNGYHLITTTAWRNKQKAAIGGVGVILSKRAESALCKVEGVSKRVMKATFVGNPETTVIVAYSPTNMADNKEEVELFMKI